MNLGKLMVIYFCCSAGAFSQEGENKSEVRITSALANGEPSTPSPNPPPHKFKIDWETQIEQGGRKVTISEVEAPVFPKTENGSKVSPSEFSEEQLTSFFKNAEQVARHFVTVSATIFDNEVTRLRIWTFDGEKREPVEAWSNIDWNYLSGFSSFEGRGQQFDFILAHGNSSLKAIADRKMRNPKIDVPQVPEQLPSSLRRGPSYLVISEGEGNKVAIEFLETIHELYTAEKSSLEEAFYERERQRKLRQEELRLNPPKPQDIEIQFWNNDVNKK